VSTHSTAAHRIALAARRHASRNMQRNRKDAARNMQPAKMLHATCDPRHATQRDKPAHPSGPLRARTRAGEPTGPPP
jgi:hypothetical protein